jgi:NAD(P)-dependent dehydrogenase (short-subunit alcohol dehydrogenase family)
MELVDGRVVVVTGAGRGIVSTAAPNLAWSRQYRAA